MEQTKLFVGQLPESLANDAALSVHFQQFGALQSCKVFRTKDGRPRASVEFADAESARNAKRHGKTFGNQDALKIFWHKEKGTTQPKPLGGPTPVAFGQTPPQAQSLFGTATSATSESSTPFASVFSSNGQTNNSPFASLPSGPAFSAAPNNGGIGSAAPSVFSAPSSSNGAQFAFTSSAPTSSPFDGAASSSPFASLATSSQSQHAGQSRGKAFSSHDSQHLQHQQRQRQQQQQQAQQQPSKIAQRRRGAEPNLARFAMESAQRQALASNHVSGQVESKERHSKSAGVFSRISAPNDDASKRGRNGRTARDQKRGSQHNHVTAAPVQPRLAGRVGNANSKASTDDEIVDDLGRWFFGDDGSLQLEDHSGLLWRRNGDDWYYLDETNQWQLDEDGAMWQYNEQQQQQQQTAEQASASRAHDEEDHGGRAGSIFSRLSGAPVAHQAGEALDNTAPTDEAPQSSRQAVTVGVVSADADGRWFQMDDGTQQLEDHSGRWWRQDDNGWYYLDDDNQWQLDDGTMWAQSVSAASNDQEHNDHDDNDDGDDDDDGYGDDDDDNGYGDDDDDVDDNASDDSAASDPAEIPEEVSQSLGVGLDAAAGDVTSATEHNLRQRLLAKQESGQSAQPSKQSVSLKALQSAPSSHPVVSSSQPQAQPPHSASSAPLAVLRAHAPAASTRSSGPAFGGPQQRPQSTASLPPMPLPASGAPPASDCEGRWRLLEARTDAECERLQHSAAASGQVVASTGAIRQLTVGVCEDMCPELERYRRSMMGAGETEGHVWQFEMSDGMPDHRLLVKEYRKEAADSRKEPPSLLRTVDALERTSHHLLVNVVDGYYGRFPTMAAKVAWYSFLSDRLRSIRKDMKTQKLFNVRTMALLEQSARFHLAAAHILRDAQVEGDFSAKLNDDRLNDTIGMLSAHYKELRQGDQAFPCEAEIVSYMVLRGGNEKCLQGVPPAVLASPNVRRALRIVSCISSRPHNRDKAMFNFARFFRLLKREATFLEACACTVHFEHVREHGLRVLQQSTRSRMDFATLARMFGFDNDEDVEHFLLAYKVDVTNSGVMMGPQQGLEKPSIPPTRVHTWISQLLTSSLGETIAGQPLAPLPAYAPMDSFSSTRPQAVPPSMPSTAAASEPASVQKQQRMTLSSPLSSSAPEPGTSPGGFALLDREKPSKPAAAQVAPSTSSARSTKVSGQTALADTSASSTPTTSLFGSLQGVASKASSLFGAAATQPQVTTSDWPVATAPQPPDLDRYTLVQNAIGSVFGTSSTAAESPSPQGRPSTQGEPPEPASQQEPQVLRQQREKEAADRVRKEAAERERQKREAEEQQRREAEKARQLREAEERRLAAERKAEERRKAELREHQKQVKNSIAKETLEDIVRNVAQDAATTLASQVLRDMQELQQRADMYHRAFTLRWRFFLWRWRAANVRLGRPDFDSIHVQGQAASTDTHFKHGPLIAKNIADQTTRGPPVNDIVNLRTWLGAAGERMHSTKNLCGDLSQLLYCQLMVRDTGIRIDGVKLALPTIQRLTMRFQVVGFDAPTPQRPQQPCYFAACCACLADTAHRSQWLKHIETTSATQLPEQSTLTAESARIAYGQSAQIIGSSFFASKNDVELDSEVVLSRIFSDQGLPSLRILVLPRLQGDAHEDMYFSNLLRQLASDLDVAKTIVVVPSRSPLQDERLIEQLIGSAKHKFKSQLSVLWLPTSFERWPETLYEAVLGALSEVLGSKSCEDVVAVAACPYAPSPQAFCESLFLPWSSSFDTDATAAEEIINAWNCAVDACCKVLSAHANSAASDTVFFETTNHASTSSEAEIASQDQADQADIVQFARLLQHFKLPNDKDKIVPALLETAKRVAELLPTAKSAGAVFTMSIMDISASYERKQSSITAIWRAAYRGLSRFMSSHATVHGEAPSHASAASPTDADYAKDMATDCLKAASIFLLDVTQHLKGRIDLSNVQVLKEAWQEISDHARRQQQQQQQRRRRRRQLASNSSVKRKWQEEQRAHVKVPRPSTADFHSPASEAQAPTTSPQHDDSVYSPHSHSRRTKSAALSQLEASFAEERAQMEAFDALLDASLDTTGVDQPSTGDLVPVPTSPASSRQHMPDAEAPSFTSSSTWSSASMDQTSTFESLLRLRDQIQREKFAMGLASIELEQGSIS